MSENKPDGAPLDPKEQMRQALEAKQKAAHRAAEGRDAASDTVGGPRTKAAAKRQFRRKAGG